MKNKVNLTQHFTPPSASASASAVSADWLVAPPLQNVRVDTQYVGIIEEQKQQSAIVSARTSLGAIYLHPESNIFFA